MSKSRLVGAVLVGWFAISLACGAQITHALAVGIADYQDDAIDDLDYAARDAEDLALALRLQCGVPAESIRVQTGSAATREGIRRGIADLAMSTGPEDTVLLFFSCHGSSASDTDGDEADGDSLDEALLPYDAVKGDQSTYILDDELGRWVSRIRAEVVILFDACHSGGQGKSVQGAGASAKGASGTMAKDLLTDPDARGGRAVLAACQPRQLAFEDEELGHGVFTHYVLEALTSPVGLVDKDLDGHLTLPELEVYVSEKTRAWASSNGTNQDPLLSNDWGLTTSFMPVFVRFADPDLEALVREKLGNPDDPISPEHTLTITSIFSTDGQVSDLAGIEYLTNLRELAVEGSTIESLEPIRQLVRLRSLNLTSCRLTDISPLAGLTALEDLVLDGNRIEDIGALAGMVNLTRLLLTSNVIVDVTPLEDLVLLTELHLASNEIDRVEALAGLTKLEYLFMATNGIRDITPLAGLTALRELDIGSNLLREIDALREMSSLRWLSFSYNSVEDLSSLTTLTNLEVVWMRSNRIADVSPLETLTRLGENSVGESDDRRLGDLDLQDNLIWDLSPLLANPGLDDGDVVDVRLNLLDQSAGSQAVQDIAALRARGVTVLVGDE